MNPDLYKLIYCSRNLIRGNNTEVAAELQQILASSRINNHRAGITGAMLYNAGMFAQVLEGSLESVGRIFETIQCDGRHGEVVVIQSGPTAARDFPEWSMAFTGSAVVENLPLATAAFDAAFTNAAGAGDQMLSILKDLVSKEDDWVLLDAA